MIRRCSRFMTVFTLSGFSKGDPIQAIPEHNSNSDNVKILVRIDRPAYQRVQYSLSANGSW